MAVERIQILRAYVYWKSKQAIYYTSYFWTLAINKTSSITNMKQIQKTGTW